jgi:hypothetical protein
MPYIHYLTTNSDRITCKSGDSGRDTYIAGMYIRLYIQLYTISCIHYIKYAFLCILEHEVL